MDREESVRRTDQVISKVIELWPFWVLLSGVVVGSINFYNTVKEVAAKQKAAEMASEQRRTVFRDEIATLRLELAVLKNDVEWIKHEHLSENKSTVRP